MSSSNQQQCANKGKSSLELEMSSVVLEQLFWVVKRESHMQASDSIGVQGSEAGSFISSPGVRHCDFAVML